jgi:hypothetical protein
MGMERTPFLQADESWWGFQRHSESFLREKRSISKDLFGVHLTPVGHELPS